ncbi:MAG TPA: copper resistance CopC family protein [Pseudonocardiaceae bacterium]|nr:copper resistance CopC family protein [Pseudonocardiaceae bacterium]
MRRLVVLAVGALLAALTVVGLATPASAHDVLVGSLPATGAQLTTGPLVIGPDGRHWERTPHASVLGDSALTQVAPPGPAGKYTAAYHIISADSHPVSGSITFELTKPGTGKPVSVAAAPCRTGCGS